uniref:PP1-binding domain-containing protein n=1 Tax=Bursaphelenchus xylophilus TaxID=6326 RepID=A0A1I7S3E0_BURXY
MPMPESSLLKSGENDVLGTTFLNVTDGSLWRTKINSSRQNTVALEEESRAKENMPMPESSLLKSGENDVLGTTFLNVTDGSLWRTKINGSRQYTAASEEECRAKENMPMPESSLLKSGENDVLGTTFQNVTDGSLRRTKINHSEALQEPPLREEEELSENLMNLSMSEFTGPVNPLLRKFSSNLAQKSRQSLMPLDPRRPSVPRMSLGPMFRNLSLKRKSSLNSEISNGSSPHTSSGRSSRTSEPSTPRSPARKVMSLTKKSSPKLVDRVRIMELIKAAQEKSYASPTISSLSKSKSDFGSPDFQVVLNPGKRRDNKEGRSSALEMIAYNYQTPTRDERNRPLEEEELLSGPIPSQPARLSHSVNPRILFDGEETVINSGDLLSQPIQSQKNQPLGFLNESDITLGSESPLRKEDVRISTGHLPSESHFFSDSVVGLEFCEDLPGSSQDSGFDSTKIMSFARESDDTGASLQLEEGLRSPAPKHLVIAAKKQKPLKEAKIRPPKIVVGADEFASDHNLRRSTRTRPTRRLNHGAGERLIYSPGGSVIGIEQGKIYHPLCIKYNTPDLAKAFEMDKKAKKNRAEMRKVQREGRNQRLAQSQ